MDVNELEELLEAESESQKLDFKESCPWEVDKYAKDILAFSNLKGGGYIIIGMKEDGGSYQREGVKEEYLAKYDRDIMKDQISSYADPSVDFLVHKLADKKGLNFVVIEVREFIEVPIICKKDGKETRRYTIYYTGENPWGIKFLAMFHMANDSHLFRTKAQLEAEGFRLWGNRFIKGDEVWLPLYEAKMIWQFDHRFGSYQGVTSRSSTHLPTPTPEQYADPNFIVMPWYWVPENEVNSRLESRDRSGNVPWKWEKQWLLGFRDVTNATNERTAILSFIPRNGIGHTAPLIFPSNQDLPGILFVLSQFNSLPFDYFVRQKMGGTHLTYNYLNQLPVFPPNAYPELFIKRIIPRAFELSYTSWEMKSFADDIWKNCDDGLRVSIKNQWEDNKIKTEGHTWNPPGWIKISKDGIHLPPFKWEESRRAILRAELDAYYAKLYGLTRDELRYILDPKDIYGSDFPSETFRVLKEKEEREFGEYSTKRLILEAWDRIT